MHRVLLAGLPVRLATWLAQRLPGSTVEVAFTAEDALAQLRGGHWSLLLLDSAVEGLAVETVVRRVRETRGVEGIPVFVALDGSEGDERLHRLVDELRVDRIFLHPLDRGELARDVADTLARQPSLSPAGAAAAPLTPGASPTAVPIGPPGMHAAPREEVEAALAAVWERSRPAAFDRLDVVERAIVSMVDGSLGAAERRNAESEAHRLAGLLGTFGSHDGTRLARQIEHVLAGTAPLTRPDGARLAKLAGSLRAELEGMSAAPGAAPAPAPHAMETAGRRDPRPLLLLIGGDAAAGRALETEAAARGMRVRAATDVSRARVALAAEAPDAVVLDLSAEGDAGELVPELARSHPGVPVLALTDRAALPDRVRLLQHGVRIFLQKPVRPAEVVDAAARILPAGAAAERRILAVDDDPAILAALKVLLEPQHLAVHTLSDPLRFWSALEEADPELLVLDVDMPHLSGIELCRVVRADHRRGRIPILFLTAHTDRETILRVFAAGGDDFVTKPMVGPELVARIRNRLDRA
jgi:DNA-binding response OmpR family regulator